MSQISPVFSSEKELFSWTYQLQKTQQMRKTISPVWNKILKICDTLFEHTQIEVQYCKNYFNFFLWQEVGPFGNNIETELHKPHQ